jgi:hypothetical protein
VEERCPLERGWRGVFSPWRKKGKGIGKLLEMISSPIWLLFWCWEGDREAAEVALRETAADEVNFILYTKLLGVE